MQGRLLLVLLGRLLLLLGVGMGQVRRLLRLDSRARLVIDADPLALGVLLPQRDIVIPAGDGQDVAGGGPRDAPHGIVECVQDTGGPL